MGPKGIATSGDGTRSAGALTLFSYCNHQALITSLACDLLFWDK